MGKTIVARVHIDSDAWRWIRAEALLRDTETQEVLEEAIAHYRSWLEQRRIARGVPP